MKYTLAIEESARRDFRGLSPEVSRRIVGKLDTLRDNLAGDVKRLTSHDISYRLRVGDYRVLFDIDDDVLKIQRVIHRRKAYD